ncbi:hypothetical protein [Zunongwangia sp. HGR-M22]|uniref:hypothetical protein n=1 Tax=Zunongwangia sp. HGR-M22 TaxID=3015168 RepID=UPI0022DD0CB4|nr:hypothetical protein [Zunongwangia sp. HGR-M22]WBL24147.1 hypothetical protein PBT91_09420 [Zunongwangia sp. HGR-M22]
MFQKLTIKIFAYSIIVSLAFSCKNDVKISEDEYQIASDTINFQWLKLKQDGFTINHGAILLPVKFEGIDKTFKMQLDLGINHNVIYGDSLEVITSAYPNLSENIQHRDSYNVFYNKLAFRNDQELKSDNLLIQQNFGDNGDLNDLDLIGTIGANEIKGKILIIDFKSQNLVLTDKLETWEEQKFSFTPLKFKNNQLYLDLIAGGNRHRFMYSTQASLFPLTTVDKSLFDKLTNKSIKENKQLKSFGEKISFTGSDITTAVRIADLNLPINNKKAFFTEAKTAVKTLESENIKGVIGNDLFMNNTIVIDLVNNRFGIQ